MSLDDQIQDDDAEPPTICDECFKQLEATEPTIVGWQLLVFKCVLCQKEFCSHLEAKDLTCVDCAEKK